MHASSRTGTTTYAYKANAPFVESVTNPDGTAVAYAYDAHGRLSSQALTGPDEVAQYARYAYDLRGNLTHVWGNGAMPLRYGYDALGRRDSLKTYRGGAGWDSPTFPTAAFAFASAADETEWSYDPATSLLASKRDAHDKGTNYAYDDLGRVRDLRREAFG